MNQLSEEPALTEQDHQGLLSRYRTVLVLGAVLLPAWGPLLAYVLLGTEQVYAWRFACAGLLALMTLLTYVSGFVRRHIEALIFLPALTVTAFALHVAKVNDYHSAYIHAFQLLSFAVTICFEKERHMLAYVALVSIAVVATGFREPDGNTWIFAASTVTFGLIAAVISHERRKLVAGLRRARHQEETIRLQQAQIAQSSKLSMLGEMSGGVAHEINNPLAVIVGYAQRLEALAARSQLDPKEISRIADRTLSMANRIAKIVRGLRFFAREASGDPFEAVTLQKIVHDTLELCAERFSSHGVVVRLAPDLDQLKLDCRQVQISQVILNLLNNSFDAVRSLDSRWISIDAEQEKGLTRLRVSDSGSGIPSQIAAKIMQPFFTTKPVGQGTGLGLSICQGIVQSHGGRIYLDPAWPTTSFVVELPTTQTSRIAA